MEYDVIFAGFGGQGLRMASILLALALELEGKPVLQRADFGPQQRDGPIECTVVTSTEPLELVSPVRSRPYAGVAMNTYGHDWLENLVRPGGVLLVNTSLSSRKVARTDIAPVLVPLNDIAEALGDRRYVAMIAIGALVQRTGLVAIRSAVDALPLALPSRHASLIEASGRAIAKGAEYVAQAS